MQKATFVPGAIATPGAITLPVPFANMRRVSTAQILRATHAHDLVSQGLGGAVANALGLPAGLNVLNDAGAAALHTVPGAGATGVQNNPAATPIVAAVPTLITNRTFSLSVNTLLGDLLELVYEQEGGQAVP
ncbi:MAG: hypothetical protein Q7K03_02315 [Dehalococcoidia bacterium]|nr:hypothetical protein [Dehalococcoidia bacterium]